MLVSVKKSAKYMYDYEGKKLTCSNNYISARKTEVGMVGAKE